MNLPEKLDFDSISNLFDRKILKAKATKIKY